MMFYKETNFKETSIGKIPEDWRIEKLERVISLCQNGLWGDTPEPDRVSYPVIRSTEITYDGKIDLLTVALRKIPENKIKQYELQEGDILIVSSSGSSHLIGRAALFCHPNDGKRYLFSNFMIRMRPKNMDSRFLYYFLNSTPYYLFLKNLQQTSTGLRNLPKRKLLQLNVPLPPLEEQKAIAHILSTIDKAIQKTNEIISKTERLKKGLMQELLTKGIGHKEFKDTEIGKIPKEWKVVRLKDVVEINRENKDPVREMPNDTFIYVDIDSVEGDTGKIKNPKKILGKKAPSRARRVIHENDVIMSTVRPYLKAFAIVPKEYDNQICSTGFAVLTCKKGIIDPYYLLTALFSENVITQCNMMMVEGQYPALNQAQVPQIKIPLPPFSEQLKISDIFATIDKKLEVEKNEKAKLERIKQAMMDLLLTGKVRIKTNV